MTVTPENREKVLMRVDARRLWAGGGATAIVAALTALVGVLICRWLFNIWLLSPKSDGSYGDVHTTGYLLYAAAAALLATGLMHLLLLGTPRPFVFFGSIVALLTALAVAFPFSTTAPLSQKVATAFVNLALGVVIGSLVYSVASRSVVRVTEPGRRTASGSYDPDQPGPGYL
jgi:hypothetical protein